MRLRPDPRLAPVMNKPSNDRIIPDTAEAEAFVRGLVENGKVGERDQQGRLQPGVTHEILGTAPSGLPIVREVRKSAF